MSTTLTITFPNPNGIGIKNHLFKGGPGTLLAQIIEDVCNKYQLGEPDGFALEYNKKILDSSLSLRFSNLKTNSKLNLVKVASKKKNGNSFVEIALQWDSNRFIEKFRTSTTLLDMLNQFDKKYNNDSESNLLQCDDQGNWLSPSCHILNRVVFGLKDLSTTTFQSLGLQNGNALVRLTFKNSLDNIQLVKEKLNEIDNMNSRGVNTENTLNDFKLKPEIKPGMNLLADKKENVLVNQIIESNIQQGNVALKAEHIENNVQSNQTADNFGANDKGRDTHVYLAPPKGLPYSNQIQLPDSAFELSPTELKLMVSQQQNSTKKIIEGAPLMTKAMRSQEEQKRRAKYPKTIIRIRLPDGVILQFTFGSEESFKELIKEIQNCFMDATAPFYLIQSPPLKKFNNLENSSFYDLNLFPASLLHLKFNDAKFGTISSIFLNQDILSLAQPLPELQNISETLKAPHTSLQNSSSAVTSISNTTDYLSSTSTPTPARTQDKVEEKAKPNDTKSKISKWIRLSKPTN
ncbi:hypothetical protein K502DRAFT_347211 [Neoconidiobolus thromboides FSU 785]|nr:hypothetical protein K502DRAFT_347211 [Neoconidiobolus thromboides FSU 785]